MNEKQRLALSRAIEGHNLLLLGQSGTGKSFTVEHIHSGLTEKGLNVVKSGTTGIAALHIGGVTLHSWSGYADGRYSQEELLLKLQTDDNFESHKRNILSAQALVIDEISMMSCKMFEIIEFVCRNMKDPNKYFGGIQVIGVGDFFQLPPVPDANTEDPGDFCFKSPLFSLVFPHTVTLTEVVRQNEPDLVHAIHETSIGTCSVETLNLLKRLSRPLPPGETPVRLCGRRFDCDVYNADKLMDIDGDMFVYKSVDEGRMSELNKMVVPESLHLKVGCPVLLVKNLSKNLVNGMCGKVIECLTDAVVVDFPGARLAPIKKQTFSVFNKREGKIIASREQIPLILSFSLTIHKAQGMTLERVEVDASNIFAPGQLGVAIGRAKTKKGLRIIGFRPSELRPVSPDVKHFYTRIPTPFCQTLECCTYSVTCIQQLLTDYDTVETESDEESEFSDTEIYDIDAYFDRTEIQQTRAENNVEAETVNANFPFEFSRIEGIFSEETVTQKQASIQTHLKQLKQNSELKAVIGKIYSDVNTIIGSKCKDLSQRTEPKNWTTFYSEMYQYSKSEKYTSYISSLYQHPPTELGYDAVGKILDKVVEIIIEDKTAHLLEESNDSANPIALPISDAGLGKIRYIGGRCVAKSKYHLMKSVKSNLHKKQKKQYVNKSYGKVHMLDFISTHSINNSSKLTPTLKETERRQNLSRGLTHISDECFSFFCSVNRVRMQHQTDKKLLMHGSDALIKTKEEVLKDAENKAKWNEIFKLYKASDETEEMREELRVDIVTRFLKIGDNQFRKDTIRKMGKKKTEALRKKVVVGKQVKTQKQSKPEAENIEPGPSGVSSSKVTKRRKCNENNSCKKGKISWSKKGKKSKSKTVYCGFCGKEYNDAEPWVQCDLCDGWFDCVCQNVTETEFERLSKEEDVSWFCTNCE